MSETTNRQWILSSRPRGTPSAADFELREEPVGELADGEVLVASRYLSVDPYMRGRMRAGRSYIDPVEVGDVMPGGGVGEVVASRSDRLAVGDFVEGMLGWQTHLRTTPKGLRKLDPELAPVSTALGVLGMPGMTAYFGLTDVGEPREGETVLVSAAAGAVGSLVGQIAKLRGCRAVGIAGGPTKCAHVTGELGFDACIDHRAEDLSEAIARTCPDGVNVYFDNVGGRTLDAALRHIAIGARIVICGMISEYNLAEPELVPRPTAALLVNRARMQGFIVTDYLPRYREGLEAMAGWLREDKIRYREDVVDGVERMPEAFLRLFTGENLGKQLVRVG